MSSAQSLTPTVYGTSGSAGGTAQVSLEWTAGEAMTMTLQSAPVALTQGFHQTGPLRLRIRVNAFLEGAYDPGSGLMRDDLRTGSLPVSYPLVPAVQPYGVAPWSYMGSEAVVPGVLSVTGAEAVVDWVLLELRSPVMPGVVVARRAALLQRDGDVVEVDGVSPVAFQGLPAGSYHVAVRHRNHLGMMSASAIALGPVTVAVDLTIPSTATWGTNARKSVVGAYPALVMWMGNSRVDNRIKYTGTANDRDPILVVIGGSVPTTVVNGYFFEDNTLDGRVMYTGAGNDRDPILLNLPGIVTTFRQEQLPTP